jgi:hypothetical protein
LAELGYAQSRRALSNRIEDRLSIGWRAADDVEHLACSRLIFERLLQLARACLLSFKQPRVLDDDDGLVREGLAAGSRIRKKGPRSVRATIVTPIGAPFRNIGTKRPLRKPITGAMPSYSASSSTSRDMDDCAI